MVDSGIKCDEDCEAVFEGLKKQDFDYIIMVLKKRMAQIK